MMERGVFKSPYSGKLDVFDILQPQPPLSR
jgi:hypothetical protein